MKLSGERHPEGLVVMFLRGTSRPRGAYQELGGHGQRKEMGRTVRRQGTSSREKKTQIHDG